MTCGSRGINVDRNAARFSVRMNIATFEGIIENGQIKLPENVRVPDRTKVYVVIPGVGLPSAARWMSPRLADPDQAKDFMKTVIPNANV